VLRRNIKVHEGYDGKIMHALELLKLKGEILVQICKLTRKANRLNSN